MEDQKHVLATLIISVHVCFSSTTVDPNMCGTSLCCPDYKIEEDRCIVCPIGTHGQNCINHCTDGFYGQKCKKKCPSKCNKTCNKLSGACPGYGPDKNTTSWMIIGVSSIFVSFSCIGTIIFCKICKSKKEAVTPTFHILDQNFQQLNGLRYESDGIFSNNSSSLQPPHRVHENNTSRTENAATRTECEYSKSKKHHSLVRKITISREMTSHSEYSDDNDDMYGSDEIDDNFDVCKTVQISDLLDVDSFKTFQSEDIKTN